MSSAVRSPLRPALVALLVAAAVALGGCGSATAGSGHDHSAAAPASVSGSKGVYAGVQLPVPYPRPSFTLTDTSGAPFDFAKQTAGTPTLLFFGYTNCPDVCPTTLADIAVALRGLDPALAARVQVVFVTTDPKRDTSAVLAQYLARFDADLPKRFIGLTGDQAAIDQAQRATGVPLAEDGGQQHSALLLLYGPDNEAHVAFDSGNTSRDIASDLRRVAGA